MKSISDDSDAGWFQAVLVEFDNESTAKLAYSQLHGHIVEGIPLFVDWASEFSKTPKHAEREQQRKPVARETLKAPDQGLAEKASDERHTEERTGHPSSPLATIGY